MTCGFESSASNFGNLFIPIISIRDEQHELVDPMITGTILAAESSAAHELLLQGYTFTTRALIPQMGNIRYAVVVSALKGRPISVKTLK